MRWPRTVAFESLNYSYIAEVAVDLPSKWGDGCYPSLLRHEPLSGACLALDTVTDGAIDLADYAEFEAVLDGPQQ